MKRILLAAALVALALPAWANTRFGFGTVVEVDAEGKKPQNKGVPSFTVFHEFRNLVDGREFCMRTACICSTASRARRRRRSRSGRAMYNNAAALSRLERVAAQVRPGRFALARC